MVIKALGKSHKNKFLLKARLYVPHQWVREGPCDPSFIIRWCTRRLLVVIHVPLIFCDSLDLSARPLWHYKLWDMSAHVWNVSSKKKYKLKYKLLRVHGVHSCPCTYPFQSIFSLPVLVQHVIVSAHATIVDKLVFSQLFFKKHFKAFERQLQQSSAGHVTPVCHTQLSHD